MSFQAVQDRLTQLQETTSQLKTLIDRLANLKLQPGSAALGSAAAIDGEGVGEDEDSATRRANVVAELSADITQGLRETSEDLEVLQEDILDLRTGRQGTEADKARTRLKDIAARLGQELRDCRISFRKALHSAHQGLAAAQRAERAALLASYAAPPPPPPSVSLTSEDGDGDGGGGGEASPCGASSPRPDNPDRSSGGGHSPPQPSPHQQQQQPSSLRRSHHHHHHHKQNRPPANPEDEAVLGASHDVTLSLRRTHDLISAELARSSYAAQALAESTAALAQLDEKYQGLDGMLAASRDLLGTLLRSQKSDTWYLQTALYVLLGTLAWLVVRRWLYGPLWWVVWMPLRVALWVAWRGVGGGVGLLGGGQRESPSVVALSGSASSVATAVISSSSVVVAGSVAGSSVAPTASSAVSGGDVDVADDANVAVADPDSLLEKVGKMIEGEGSGPSQGDEVLSGQEKEASKRGADEEGEAAKEAPREAPPNPKKRMWEEDKEAAKHAAAAGERGQQKDEL